MERLNWGNASLMSLKDLNSTKQVTRIMIPWNRNIDLTMVIPLQPQPHPRDQQILSRIRMDILAEKIK